MRKRKEPGNSGGIGAVPEFSRPIDPARLSRKVCYRKISADAEECLALAKRFSLERLDLLEADLALEQVAGGLKVSGEIRADLVQRCVVSLEPLPRQIRDSFEEVYRRESVQDGNFDWNAAAELAELDHDGKLDLGEMVAQELSGLLESYPHAPGVRFEWQEDGDPPADQNQGKIPQEGPFSALAALKRSR